EREHERQPEDPGTEPDADGVDEGDEDLGPGVPTEGHPAADARLVDAVAGPSWGEPDEPLPDVPAVLEEEEETEERDDGPGDDLGDRGRGCQGAGDEGVGVGLELGQALVEPRLQLLLVDAERSVGEPGDELVEPLDGLVGEVGEPDDDRASGR